jgi:hypothetical protein
MSDRIDSLAQMLDSLKASLTDRERTTSRITSCARSILEFLNQPGNNNHENCCRVNDFVLLKILTGDLQQNILGRLNPDLRYVIEGMGHCLHDTHSAPEVARMFECTPEQLLQRVSRLT